MRAVPIYLWKKIFTESPSDLTIPFVITLVFAVAEAILASVIIAVLSVCVLKYKKLAKQ